MFSYILVSAHQPQTLDLYSVVNNWEKVSPESQGMNAETLRRLHTFIQDQSLPIYAMLIIRHGSLVFEHYFQEQTTADAHPIASCTKSILSALVGVALCQDSLHALDQRQLVIPLNAQGFTKRACKQLYFAPLTSTSVSFRCMV